MRSLVAGFLLLTALDAVLSSKAAANRAGGLISGTAKVVDHLLSPTVAAIPDLRKKAAAVQTSTTSASSTSASSTLPADWSPKPTAPATLYL